MMDMVGSEPKPATSEWGFVGSVMGTGATAFTPQGHPRSNLTVPIECQCQASTQTEVGTLPIKIY